MSIIRTCKSQDPYVRIDKRFLEDERLSWKAKGLLAYLLSKPDNWKVMICDLTKRSQDGQAAVTTALKELEQIGYLKRQRIHGADGRFKGWESTIFEVPQPDAENPKVKNPKTENPLMDIPVMEDPVLDNRVLITNDLITNEITNKLLTQERKSENRNEYGLEPDRAKSADPQVSDHESAKAKKLESTLPGQKLNGSEDLNFAAAPPPNFQKFKHPAQLLEERFQRGAALEPWEVATKTPDPKFIAWIVSHQRQETSSLPPKTMATRMLYKSRDNGTELASTLWAEYQESLTSAQKPQEGRPESKDDLEDYIAQQRAAIAARAKAKQQNELRNEDV